MDNDVGTEKQCIRYFEVWLGGFIDLIWQHYRTASVVCKCKQNGNKNLWEFISL